MFVVGHTYLWWINKLSSWKRQANEDREVVAAGICSCRHVDSSSLESYQVLGVDAFKDINPRQFWSYSTSLHHRLVWNRKIPGEMGIQQLME